MSNYLSKIIYLTESQYNTLITNNSITINGVSQAYDSNALYITDSNLLTSSPSASGTATAFITDISQAANGKIIATKANLPLTLTAAATGFTIAGGTTSKTLTVAGTATINAPTQGGVVYGGTSGAYSSTDAGTSGQLLQSAGTSTPTWITATDSNTASTIVKRDASGNFSAGTITAALIGDVTGNVSGSSGSCTGNADTATQLSNTPNNTTTFLRGDNSWSSTLTGGLRVKALETIDTTNNGAQIRFLFSDRSNSTYGMMWAARVANAGGRLVFGQYSESSSGTLLSYREQYYLPEPTAGLTANKNYNILTTKDMSFSITGNAATATRINGNLTQLGNVSTGHNIWVSSTNTGDGIPNIIAGVYIVPNSKTIVASNFQGNATTATTAVSLETTTSTISGGSSGTHAQALQTYFNNNKASTPRNKLLAFYDGTNGNGSITFGYFLNGYDSNPYGGFFSAHYDIPYYVGIKNGSFTQSQLWKAGDSVTGAVWNDYAEYRKATTTTPGCCVQENDNGILTPTYCRLMPGASIISDTWGFSQGESEEAKTPVAVSGRVLAYPYRDRSKYHAGQAVCSGPNGTVDIMTRREIQEYPDAIIGIVSEIPDYEEWGGGDRDPVKINGRIWIKVR